MKLLDYIRHYIWQKLYNGVEIIQKERDAEARAAILSSMAFHGNPLTLHDGYFIHGPQYMEFGDSCILFQNSWVDCIDNYGGQSYAPKLKIGHRFSMQRNGHIGCIDRIEIGDNVMLGSKVYITDHFHGEISKAALNVPPADRPLISKPVKIGNNVWIGDNVSIMPGVTLGDNVIVGANAVVTHSFTENCVIAGVPAKVIKMLCEK